MFHFDHKMITMYQRGQADETNTSKDALGRQKKKEASSSSGPNMKPQFSSESISMKVFQVPAYNKLSLT